MKETISHTDRYNLHYSVAKFRTEHILNVVDLSYIPPIPSPFDALRRHHYYDLLFLHDFTADLSAEIIKDGKAHIDYVPTQVLTEFFRFPYSDRMRNGKRIDGLKYRSSKDGRPVVVIFCDNEGSLELLQFEGLSYHNKRIKTI